MENYSAKAYYKKYKFISFHDYFTLNNTGIEGNRYLESPYLSASSMQHFMK